MKGLGDFGVYVGFRVLRFHWRGVGSKLRLKELKDSGCEKQTIHTRVCI